ncbi:cytochrome P450 3A12-like isoform X2 [Dermacentor andersoni]|uniref:cytochrome P450 3A12-like isoform X1 n=1 Tax=Dermacentor andersoni TaxID=34620 RepID=UPI002154FCB7|nr:cytochrome P450 3A12-like isoform X1 [Dermacentor andersoni]XP_054926615.1 cytochrome P450 3A12-like isoform X2 [Dermacentor andersoni]
MWAEVLLSLLLVAASASLSWFLRRKRKLGLFRRHGIPGPDPDFFWGNFLQLKEDRVQVMERWIAEYGKVFGYYSGEMPYIVVSDLDVVKECLVKEFPTFHDRAPFVLSVEPFASCMLQLKGAEWKRVRSVLNPTFSSVKMKQMAPIVRSCVDSMMEVLEERCRAQQTVDMFKVAQGFSLDVITKCAFAWQVDCQKNPNDPLLLGVRKIFEEAESAAVCNAIRFPVLRVVITALYRLSDYYKVMRRMTDNLRHVIEQRRRERNVTSTDMLQLMLEAQDGAEGSSSDTGRRVMRLIEDRHVVGNAFIFLAAGFETTATSLGFLMYLMATHPDEQERLRAELESVFGTDQEISYEGLQQLKRLDMVVQEALRIYPPVVLFISRHCDKDTTIMGHFFPAGVNIMIPTWHIHHDPALWPEPFEFRPERFDPDGSGGLPQQPAAFLPFGLGPRVCIGKRFALLELKMAVCRVLREYRILRCEETQEPLKIIVPSVIINPERGVVVRLERL